MQSVISTVNNKNKKPILRKMLPVDAEPRVGATNVPSNSVLLMEQICGNLQTRQEKNLTRYVAYQPIDDNIFN